VISNHVFVWPLFHEMNQWALTIAVTLADTINNLMMRSFGLCCIATGNTSKEVAALNPELAISVQKSTGVMVFRTSCLSQRTNLTVADFLKWLGSNRTDSCDVWAYMTMLWEPVPRSKRES
jgi:hypothetical protein